jgi:hypothetical protein
VYEEFIQANENHKIVFYAFCCSSEFRASVRDIVKNLTWEAERKNQTNDIKELHHELLDILNREAKVYYLRGF